MNLNIPGAILLLFTFSNIKKKHTYESQNTWRNFFLITFSNIKKSTLTNLKTPLFTLIIILKETIYIKTIIQIDKHKVKYTINACIPIIIIKNFYFL